MNEITQPVIKKALKEIQSSGKITSYNGTQANKVYKHLEQKGLITEHGKGWRVIGAAPGNQEKPLDETTTEDLRRNLLSTMKDLKDGKIDVPQAKAMADLAGKVIDTAKLELTHNIAQHKLKTDLSNPVKLLNAD